MNTEQMIAELRERTEGFIAEARVFQNESTDRLNARPKSGAWSVLECLEHLNRYGDFYLPEIASRIKNNLSLQAESEFKPGKLGNYFANSMIPNEKMKKMKTFKDKDPSGSALDRSVIDEFLRQQKEMLDLLEKAKRVNLTRTKTNITISKWIKLRLGDTFRFVIYHEWRHMVQAQRALQSAQKAAA